MSLPLGRPAVEKSKECVHAIPLMYVREGSQIILVNEYTGERLHAVAGMDGHMVSPNYGKSQGSDHYTTRETSYLNVLLDAVKRDRYTSDITSNYWPNTGFAERDGWSALVTSSEFYLYQAKKKSSEEEALVDAALDRVREAEQLLAEAQKELRKVKK